MDSLSHNNTITLVGMDAHSERISLCITEWSHGSDPVVKKQIDISLNDLENTYRKQVTPDSVTVLEASTNAFSIHQRLRAIGYNSKVLASDTLAGRSRADNVTDKSDALKLTVAYARGGTREVHVPTYQYRQMRDIFFGYRNAVKDSTRCSNRIWAFCSQHGLKLPKRSFKSKVEKVKEELKAKEWSQEDRFHIEVLLQNYENALKTRDLYEKRIAEAIMANNDMINLMQILGVRFIIAFAMVAFVENVTRFENHKKLVAYLGLNPTVHKSGKAEGANGISNFGRRDLKGLMIQAAQAAMRSGDTSDAKWARRKAASGKPYNVAVAALARKMTIKAWHIMMGNPVPDREEEKSFNLKLQKLAYASGKESIKNLGYKTAVQFADDLCRRHYAHLPEKEASKATA